MKTKTILSRNQPTVILKIKNPKNENRLKKKKMESKKPKAKKIVHTDTLAELNAKIEQLTLSLEIAKSMRDVAYAKQKKAATMNKK